MTDTAQTDTALTDTALADTALARPAMRGRLHLWSFFVAIAAGATLVAFTASTVSARAALGTSVYAVTVLGLFGSARSTTGDCGSARGPGRS